MQKIDEWLKIEGKRHIWLANKLGIMSSSVTRILNGEREIQLHEALEIKKLSRGFVSLSYIADENKKIKQRKQQQKELKND